MPDLPTPRTPLEAAHNAITHFAHFQLDPGNWACDYGGPLFLLPGFIIAWYVTGTQLPVPQRIEITRYLFNRQIPSDGGWGLHVEAPSSVFGTATSYISLRLLGVDPDDPHMVRGRARLHELGGALAGPHWTKFYMAVLGIVPWSVVNPVPAEGW